MSNEHNGSLQQLLAEDESARALFMTLPEHIQGALNLRNFTIDSYDALQRFATALSEKK